MRVEEQDGSVNSFQVDTATVPYLTRPGYVRYNLAVGALQNRLIRFMMCTVRPL